MNTRRSSSRLFLFALWAALSVAMIAAVRALPWQSALQQLTQVRPGWVGAALACNAGILLVWAAEWQAIAPARLRVLYAAMFEVVATMAAVLNSVPFFAGEATGVALLVGRVGLTRGAALSVLAIDQLLSGLSKLAVLGIAAAVVPLPPWLRAGVLTLVAAVTALLCILLVMAHGWQRLRANLSTTSTPLRRALARMVSLGAYLDALRETARPRRLVVLALSKKAVELAAIVAIQAAFGMPVSLAAGVLVLASIGVATLAPIAPANVGVYEAAVFAAYRYMGVAPDTALALAVVQHICFLLPMVATGYITLSVRQLTLSRRS
jgi:uncharacterized membrane protein YbhN (UPF0104 family)